MEPQRRISPEELLQHSVWMKKLALALVGDAARADDLVQQTFVSWVSEGETEERLSRPWLSSVMTNIARSGWRSESRREHREKVSARSEVQDAEEVAGTLEMHDMLMHAVKSLKPAHQTVIVRHFFEEESLAEIARGADLPESTVRNRLLRALEELREKLDRLRGGRDNWVGMFIAFATRTKPPVAHVAPAASLASMGALAWLALSAATLFVGVTAASWLWKEYRPTVETSAASFAALPGERPTVSNESLPEATSTPPTRELVKLPLSPQAPSSSTTPASLSAGIDLSVVDHEHVPLAGAVITIDAADLAELDASAEPTRTDSAGQAHIDVHFSDRSGRAPTPASRPIRLAVQASQPGQASCAAYATLELGQTTSLGQFVLQPGGSIVGRVTSSNDSALPDCILYVLPLDAVVIQGTQPTIHREQNVAHAELERDGAFAASGLPVGMYRLAILAHTVGWNLALSEPIVIRAGESTTVPGLVLERREDLITGIVRGPDKTALGGRTLAFAPSSSASSNLDDWRTLKTDEEGRFEIVAAHDGACDLYVFGDGQTSGDLLRRNVATGTEGLELSLPSPTLRDIVVVNERGSEVTSYAISFRWVSAGNSYGNFPGKRPKGAARVPMHELPSLLVVSASGYRQQEIPIDAAPRTELPPTEPLRITLHPSATVGGTVLSSGVAVAGATVELRIVLPEDELYACNEFRTFSRMLSHSSTSKKGLFVHTPNEDGRFVLVVHATDFADWQSQPFEYRRDGSLQPFEVELSIGSTLEGRVITEPGTSPAGYYVGVSCGDGACRTKSVGPDGIYRFEHLAPGRWWICRCEKDYTAARDVGCTSVGGFSPSLEEFEIEKGRPKTFDLDLRGATCTVEGSLKREPCEGCTSTATLAPAWSTHGRFPSVSLAPNGSFRLDARETGPHRLTILTRASDVSEQRGSEQRIEDEIEVERGKNPWSHSFATGTLEVDAPPRARITHTWKSGKLTCTTQFSADEHGHVRIDGIPSGSGELKIATSSITTQVDVPAAAMLPVKLP